MTYGLFQILEIYIQIKKVKHLNIYILSVDDFCRQINVFLKLVTKRSLFTIHLVKRGLLFTSTFGQNKLVQKERDSLITDLNNYTAQFNVNLS